MSTAMKGQTSGKSVGGGKVNVEGTYCTSLLKPTAKFLGGTIAMISCVEHGENDKYSQILSNIKQHVHILHLVAESPDVLLFKL